MDRPPLTANDDGFHFDQLSDRWWETETCWFSFHVPDRRLAGWLYALIRPNIGSVSGGCWVWDDTAYLPWEVPYCANYSTLRLEAGSDLRDVTLRTGFSVRAVEPLTVYEMGYVDEPRLSVRLRFDAIMEPFQLASPVSALGHSRHFDQFGRVTGSVVLDGETIAVDCLAMRDRSWGPRPEYRYRKTAYVTGITDGGNGFQLQADRGEPVASATHGFLLRDGVAQPFASATRTVQRDAEHGWVTRVVIEAADVTGRTLHAEGTPHNRIIINRPVAIDCNTVLHWRIDGEVGWGEDQDIWPYEDWAAARRSARGESNQPVVPSA